MVSATEPRLFCVPQPPVDDESAPRWNPPDGAPPGPWTIETAYRFCERMATTHYENFPVASRFLPSHLRPNVMAIYAFARTADDFADEPRYENRRVESLDRWEQLLELCYHRDVAHPVFLALRDTVRRHNIPIGPLKALLTAFRMDLTKKRYASFDEGNGLRFTKGELTLEDLARLAGQGEPPLVSGKQELIENVINQYL